MRRVPIHRKGCPEAAETKTKQETCCSCVEMEACTSQYWEKAKGYINSWHFKYFLPLPVNLRIWGRFIFPRMVIERDARSHTALLSTVLLWNKATTEFPRLLLNFLYAIRAGCSHPGRAGECLWDKEGIRQPSSKLTLKATHSALQSSRPWNRAGREQGVLDHAGDSGMHSLGTAIWLSSLLLCPIPPQENDRVPDRSGSLPGRVITDNNGPRNLSVF